MTPAFTVTYLDKLDYLFQKPVHDMIDAYNTVLTPESKTKGMKVNLMTDLHKIALEM
jgi:hypothetical protein